MIGSSQGKQEVDPFMGVVWVPNLGLSLPLILFAVTLFPLIQWEDWVKPEQARCESIHWCFVSQIWIVLASHPLCCRPPSFPTVG